MNLFAQSPTPGDERHPLDAHTRSELLVVRCQLGERAAFDELIDAWHGPLWQYARRLTGRDDAAHDISQEVWVRVIRGIVRLRQPASLRAWLFGIARRVLMDRLREQYAAPIAPDVEIDGLPSEATNDSTEEEIRQMRDGLSRLPLIEREALTLFYLQELSLAEVSDVLGVPVGTVKSRLFRARQLLRREIERTGSRT